jgi:hypothetical protein
VTKLELKQILKPLIKECIKEVIFEDGVLSGLITEVAQGLGNITTSSPTREVVVPVQTQRSENVLEAKNQLNEMKASLQKATGLQGIFEGTTPMRSQSKGQSSKYGALKDKDPSDAGVNIDGLIKMTGGWSHLTK